MGRRTDRFFNVADGNDSVERFVMFALRVGDKILSSSIRIFGFYETRIPVSNHNTFL